MSPLVLNSDDHPGGAIYDLCAVPLVATVDVHTGAEPRSVYDPVPEASSNEEHVAETLRSMPDMSLTRWPDREPPGPGVAACDDRVFNNANMGRRRRSDKRLRISVSRLGCFRSQRKRLSRQVHT